MHGNGIVQTDIDSFFGKPFLHGFAIPGANDIQMIHGFQRRIL
jgi:hypothetical protein